MSDLFDSLAARATGATPADIRLARARPVARFESAVMDEKADPIEVDVEVLVPPARAARRMAPLPTVMLAARPDPPSPVRPVETRANSSPPVSEPARAELHGPVPASVPLHDNGDATAVGTSPLPAPLTLPVVVAPPDPTEADARTMRAARSAEPVSADPRDVASLAGMVVAPAAAPDGPAAPPAAMSIASPPPTSGQMEREVSVSIGRVIVEWLDQPAHEPPAVAAPPASTRTHGFTSIAAARRGVLR